MTELVSAFTPTPPQQRFLESPAFIRAYGGALGGGKSRAMCEAIFDYALEYPGLKALIARDKHTSIVETTRATMLEQVIPRDNRIIVGRKKSGGEDYVELFNGSVIHFIGMDDPYRWYSSEIAIFALDEAQEITNHDAEKVLRLIGRLRQRCQPCIDAGQADCPHFPHKAMMSFNPSSPDHWLYSWFIKGAQQTDHGFAKDQLVLEGAESSIGDAEFVFALPTDNPYLSSGYLDIIRGYPEHLRRRYLEGKWEYLSDLGFFNPESLMFYENLSSSMKPIMQGGTAGDVDMDTRFRRDNKLGASPDPPRIKPGSGGLMVWRKPNPDHKYVMGIDVSSGGSYDYSAIQVVDQTAFEQVAEWQGKLQPHEVAVEAYRIGRVFNNALAVPELNGGWGASVAYELRKLRYPRLYTHQIIDKLSKQWTDRIGWNTTEKSRAHMLNTLETVLREMEFGLFSPRAVAELASFVYQEKRDGSLGKPEARDGANDDLVMALAIAVTVASDRRPRQTKKPVRRAARHWLRAA